MLRIFECFTTEHPDSVECKVVTGSVPKWLHGSLYRNGAGLYAIGKDKFQHVFDGMAVLHKYSIRDGHLEYCNRLLRSKAYNRNKKANRIVVSEFGTVAHPDPEIPFWSRYFYYYYDLLMGSTDNCSVNFVELGSELFTLTEPTGTNVIKPTSLETNKHVNLANYLPVKLATAHPLRDFHDTVWNCGTRFSLSSHYTVFKIPPTRTDSDPLSSLEVVCEIPARWRFEPSYYHSFGMSENYLVLVEQTTTLPIKSIISSLIGRLPVSNAFTFYQSIQCIFHVLDKRTGKLLDVKFVADAFFFLHHINTFEDDGYLVFDACCYPDNHILTTFKRPPDTSDETVNRQRASSTIDPRDIPTVWRFALPVNINKLECVNGENLVTLDYTTATAIERSDGTVFCRPEVFPDSHLEVPRINPSVTSKKHRYCYGAMSYVSPNNLSGTLVKYDTVKKQARVWSDENYVPAEPIFVASPGSTEEDDGIILSPLFGTSDDLPSQLLILNATTFTEISRVDIPVDVQVPPTFHGFFQDLNVYK